MAMSGHDLAAEQAIVGCLLNTPAAMRQLPLGPDQFDSRHRLILQALRSAIDEHGEPSVLMVGQELRKRDALDKIGGAPYLLELTRSACVPAQMSWHAQIVEEAAMRRAGVEIATRVMQVCQSGGDAEDMQVTLAHMAIELQKLADEGISSEAPLTSLSLLEDFVNEPVDPFDWVMPGILERGERLVLTAPEGVGKSVLARQVAILLAGGRHPFVPRLEVPRKRTLLVDLENPPNLIRRHARGQVSAAHANGVETGDRCWIWREPAGIDIRQDGMRAFERVLDQVQPDIVCMGPVYKLTTRHGSHDGFEEQASGIQAAIDRLRDRYGCAFWLEHHSGKGKDSDGKRTQDPYGSSFWLRWSEFGYGMSLVDGCTDGSQWALTRFRGDRDSRAWPDTLLRTGNPGAPWGADWNDPERKAALYRAVEES